MRWRTKKWKVDSQQKLSSGPLAWAACVLTTELWPLGNHQPSQYPLHILHRLFQFLLSHTWHPLSMCCQTLLGVNHKNLWEGVRMSSRLGSSVQCAVYIDLFQAMRSRHCEIMDLHTETQILHTFVQELQWVMELFGVLLDIKAFCYPTLLCSTVCCDAVVHCNDSYRTWWLCKSAVLDIIS